MSTLSFILSLGAASAIGNSSYVFSQKPTGGDSSIAPETWTTTTVDVVSTLYVPCSTPTTVTTNDQTFTVTQPTTLTITDCPCTQEKVVTKTGHRSRSSSAKAVSGSTSASESAIASATAPETTLYTTIDIVKTLTTYVAQPTTLTTNGKEYTVTAPTTLTITDCPCTQERVVASTLKSTSAFESKNASETVNAPEPVTTLYATLWTTMTTVVDTLTTSVTGPTTITTNGKEYTATGATEMTITDCPCTVTSSFPSVPATSTNYVTLTQTVTDHACVPTTVTVYASPPPSSNTTVPTASTSTSTSTAPPLGNMLISNNTVPLANGAARVAIGGAAGVLAVAMLL